MRAAVIGAMLTATLVWPVAPADAALALLPAKAAPSPRALWAAVMSELVGPYSRQQKCRLATGSDGAGYCMRPNRLETRSRNGQKFYFMAASGNATVKDPSYAATGALRLIMLTASGHRLEVVAQSGLEPAGTWGKVDPDSEMTVAQLGPNDAMGWIVTWGAAGMGGTVVEGRTYYGNIGGQIVNLGTFQTSYDQPAEAEEGEQGIDISTSIQPLTKTDDHFYPLQVHVTGTANGLKVDRDFAVTANDASGRYLILKELSDTMGGCPVGCENIK